MNDDALNLSIRKFLKMVGVTSQRELLWSTCWGCGGEGGAITFRDDATIVITQR